MRTTLKIDEDVLLAAKQSQRMNGFRSARPSRA